jgi:hypothetical protein
MPVLKSLSLASLPKTAFDPVLSRRNKLLNRLEEQRALLADPNLVRSVQRWVKKDGEKTLTTKQQRVAPWWREDGSGRLLMCVKYGNKPIEFEKGKAAIAVPSRDQLPKVIETLITALRAGELDDILAQSSKKQPAAVKARKAG